MSSRRPTPPQNPLLSILARALLSLPLALGGLAGACRASDGPRGSASDAPPPVAAPRSAGASPSSGGSPATPPGLRGRLTADYERDGSAKRTVVVLVQGDRVRLDEPVSPGVAGGGERFLSDARVEKGVLVRPAAREASVFAHARFPEFVALDGEWMSAGEDSSPAATKTGRRDEVAGVGCDEWATGVVGSRVVACASEEKVPALRLPNLRLPGALGALRPLLDGEHLPLRVAVHGKGGAVNVRFEVTRIDRTEVHPSDFRVPADYRLADTTKVLATAPASR